jgi:hypothetical protein
MRQQGQPVPKWALMCGALLAAWTLALAPAAQAEPCSNEALREQQHATFLPDCRAWEQVSPSDKNGAEVTPDSQRTRAAADGSAVAFASLAGFGDVANISVSTDYMSVRTGASGTNGWATHALAPPQAGLTFAADTHFMESAYVGEFSEDLSKGVLRTSSPLTDAPMVANEPNLYLRDDLRSLGAGTYQLLTDCPGCTAPFPGVDSFTEITQQFYFAGASRDFGHVIFESRLPLTAESTAAPAADPTAGNLNLFEWDHGTIRLAGVLPDGACGAPPCPAPQSQAGQGTRDGVATSHAISDDGSRIFFTVHLGQCAGGLTGCGDLYLREGHATTVQLNASEKTNGDGPGGTDPTGHQLAQWWDASADGARAFFTSAESLTNDAPVNGAQKLYMYSATADPQGHHLSLVSVDHEPLDDATADDSVVGVLGASADGNTVYFADQGGQLVEGASLGTPGVTYKLFRWHEGAIDYIGGILVEDRLENYAMNVVSNPKRARVTPDGKFLLFSAARGTALTGYNHGSCPDNGAPGCRELYLYRSEAVPHLRCVSCNPSGAKATADASDVTDLPAGAGATAYHLNHALSDDGRRVFFSTAEALLPEDTNGVSDAYEYDVPSETLHLLSSGTDPGPSYFMDASTNGDDAFILTRERLTGWDTDGGYDLYDARVGGGLPEPQAPVICQGETCHEAPTPAPAAPSIASAGFSGPADPRPLKCKKGFEPKTVKGKPKCLKTRKPHKRVGHKHGGAK